LRPSLALNTHREAIRRIALSHRVTNVRVFGSVVHGDDTEDSDLDLLVEPTQETTMMDIAAKRQTISNSTTQTLHASIQKSHSISSMKCAMHLPTAISKLISR
jgi:predicted nucleotidyltransferase